LTSPLHSTDSLQYMLVALLRHLTPTVKACAFAEPPSAFFCSICACRTLLFKFIIILCTSRASSSKLSLDKSRKKLYNIYTIISVSVDRPAKRNLRLFATDGIPFRGQGGYHRGTKSDTEPRHNHRACVDRLGSPIFLCSGIGLPCFVLLILQAAHPISETHEKEGSSHEKNCSYYGKRQ
jgi:hypothetical protein